jgi:5,5'-dehydrodivanillate O-demethylase
VENFGLWGANYFQILENSPDTTHTAILHGGIGGERSDIWGREIPKVSWEEDEFGIICTQRRSNYDRASHILLPTINRLAQPWPGGKFKWPRHSALWRTPVDDMHTLILSVTFTPYVDGRKPELLEGLTFDITDQLHIHRLQDYQAIVSQGEIYDRTAEDLGVSDRGVIMLRRIIMEGIQAVQRGEDPKGVLRNPEADKILDFTHIVGDTLMSKAEAA